MGVDPECSVFYIVVKVLKHILSVEIRCKSYYGKVNKRRPDSISLQGRYQINPFFFFTSLRTSLQYIFFFTPVLTC